MLPLRPEVVRARLAAYEEALHWSKFVRLWHSLDGGICFRCNRWNMAPAPDAHNPGRVVGSLEPRMNKTGRVCVADEHARWRIAHRGAWNKPGLNGMSGLVTGIRIGRRARLRLDITGDVTFSDERFTLYATGSSVVRVNGTALTFLLIDRLEGHPVHPRDGYMYASYKMRIYLQIDYRKEMARVRAAYRLVAQLRRNRKSYFSWLPRELIRLIRYHVLTY